MAEKIKLPYGATHFVDDNKNVVQFVEKDGKKVPMLKMTAYSGGMIDHWYWGKFVINTEGIKLSGRTPILEDHMTDKKIAVGEFTKENGALVSMPETTNFLSTKEAKEFLSNCENGFPYQSSIYAKPTKVTRFEEPADIELNGKKFSKIDCIWDSCMLKEASICVFGYDSNTKAMTMAEDEIDVDGNANDFKQKSPEGGNITTPKEVNTMAEKMTLEQFKADHKDVADQFAAEILETEKKKGESIETRLTAVTEGMKELGVKVASLETENAKLSTENTTLKTTISQLSKDKEAAQVDAIWTEKLSASSIPETIRPKVKLAVNEDKFRKEGVLDTVALTAAIEAEIKEWEDAGVSSNEALGFGSQGSSPTGSDETKLTEKDTKETVDYMSTFLDQKTIKK
jgi:regulator of replication initiation timing